MRTNQVQERIDKWHQVGAGTAGILWNVQDANVLTFGNVTGHYLMFLFLVHFSYIYINNNCTVLVTAY